jgi:hypothetical protein
MMNYVIADYLVAENDYRRGRVREGLRARRARARERSAATEPTPTTTRVPRLPRQRDNATVVDLAEAETLGHQPVA